MRLAAALFYLSSVTRAAAIGYGFPSGKSTSNFIDANPVSAGGYSIPNQFVKNLKLANLVAGRPSPPSACGMAFDPVAFKKTKHILRAAEFLRDLVTREVVSVEHISGVVMLADILTKAASRGVFVDLIKQLDSFA